MRTKRSIALPQRKRGHEDAATCKACGGNCCKEMPGCAFPEDFFPEAGMLDLLTHALRSGFWAIDWWEGDPRKEPGRGGVGRAYIIRPATVRAKAERRIKDPSWGGQCALWCEGHGCSLTFNERPTECRMLKPRTTPDGDCRGNKRFGKQAAAVAWLPYTDIIERAHARATGAPEPASATHATLTLARTPSANP